MYYNGLHSQNMIYNRFFVNLNLGSDVILESASKSKKTLSIYIGHHKDFGVLFANIICPALSIFEKAANYVNFFQKFVFTKKILKGPLMGKQEKEILSTLYMLFFKTRGLCKMEVEEGLDELQVSCKLITTYFNVLFKASMGDVFFSSVYFKNSKIFSYITNHNVIF